MNIPVMRVYNSLLSMAILITTLSCKKEMRFDQPLPDKCTLAGFTLLGISYAFEYGSNNSPGVMSRVRGGGPGYPTLFFEYKDEKLAAISIEINGTKYPRTQYEYQNNRLSRIQNFDILRTAPPETNLQIKLSERIDFRYNSGDKPTGLTRWFPGENGQLYKSHESLFEYDGRGNLVVEKMHAYPRQSVIEADYRYEYFYDEKPNTRKPLHYLFFAAAESAPSVFSRNNMNRLTIAYEGKTISDHTFRLTYDPNGNVAADSYQYADIQWLCE